MDRGAYPEIGQRITISQGTERTRRARGLGATDTNECLGRRIAGSPSTIRRRVDDKFVVRPLRRGECVLDETHETVVRVIEHAKAAFASLNGLLIPRFCKEGALAAERLDEYLDLSVAKGAREVGAKFGEQPFRPVLPVGNELTSGGLEERIAQEVALTIAIQPAAKEPRRRLVPAARVPEAIEAIGRAFDRFDGGNQRGGRVCRRPARSLRIDTPRKLEQIVVLGARQRESLRNAAESLGGGLHRAPLLDPRAPGHADAGERREFLAPKTRGSPPASRRPWPFTLSVGANELAEESPLIRFKHSGPCNRIRFNLVTV
jgi:hypothetical protein